MANARTQTILSELDRAETDLREALASHAKAQAEYDAARERFIGMRKLAASALSSAEWFRWEQNHPFVTYVGMEIGDAIIRVLEVHTYERAFAHIKNPKEQKFIPTMHVDKIIDALETGGFDFGTSTPKRVINAAALNKKKVRKVDGAAPFYQLADADDYLNAAKEVEVFQKADALAEKEEAARAAEEVPF